MDLVKRTTHAESEMRICVRTMVDSLYQSRQREEQRSPFCGEEEDEGKFEQGFKDLNLAAKESPRESHKEARRKMHGDKGGEEKGKEEASLEAGGQNHIKMIMGG
ncbi:unnamed protein product [Brassica oleracea var. botrytis]|uniref:(rape) hypothetical protein n=1 Tax=Brassica napus TaxID=3708 RepID=A0A816IRA8_BRANA|nr:unnamed protein product [Brassica napus]